jgi:hypothetical protein
MTGVVMSERMSSVEIEDVLSSIRRLVTQDLRPKPPAIGDKLLLTPALRVVPAVDASEPAPTPTATADEPEDAAHDLPSEAPFSDDAAVAADVLSTDTAIPVFFHRHSAVPDLAQAVTSIGAEVPAEGYEPENGETGPADAMQVPDWPDSSWDAPDVISEVDEAEVVALPDTAPGWVQEDDPEPAGEAAVREAPFVEAPFVEAGDDDAEFDADGAGDISEAEALAAFADDDESSAYPALTELDEGTLREIVRDIIREELQGALGESITRNVRKLVRAEINRAMVARDLE